MKEMVGGCCVCSDEHGWTENPLVYCDGQNCTVAVHQACYGIVTVPTGPWFCRKCESQERSARVRCELCPSRDGALKKTDNQGWAHVVCALYIPEVRFGNVTTMEPIILQLIPPERYAKTCYICTEMGKPARASCGACMQCNKSGCKQQFHVTCAQALGLLCEEAGNYLDNVKYCGYCQHHYSKLKKGGNVKTIPPYKPITHETGSSASDPPSSPEKDTSNQNNSSIPSSSATSNSTSIKSAQQTVVPVLSSNSASSSSATSTTTSSSKQRKSGGQSKASLANTSAQLPPGNISNINSSSIVNSTITNTTNNKTITTNIGKDKEKHTKNTNSKISSTNKNHDKESSSSTSSSMTTNTRDKSSKSSKNNNNTKEAVTESLIAASSNDLKVEKTNINVVLTPATTATTTIITPTSLAHTTKPSTHLTTTSIIVANTKDTTNQTKELLGQKFTTSNFTETIVVNSESVFGNEIAGNNKNATTASGNSLTTTSTTTTAKKRKSESNKSAPNIEEINKDLIKEVSVTLVQLPASKLELHDIEKINKKAKIELNKILTNQNDQLHQNTITTTASTTISNNPLKSPILLQQPTIILKQVLPPNTTATSVATIQQPIIKQHVMKDLTDNRQTHLQTGTFQTVPATAPSLVVSVPLSTAGVNLTSNTTMTTNNQSIIGQSGQNLYQQIQQQQQTSAILSSHNANQYQQNPINHNNITSMDRQSTNLQQIITNVSPSLMQQQQQQLNLLDSTEHNLAHPIQQSNILPSTSPAASVSNKNANVTPIICVNTDNNNSVLKINYEKQKNRRVTQLQEDVPTKRSRSQSGETNKSSTYKKKGVAIISSPTTTTSSSSTSTTTSSSSSLYPDNTATILHSTIQNINLIDNLNNKKQIIISGPASSSSSTSTSIKKSTRNKTNETQSSSTSRTTPDTNYTTISYGGGLKFTYEAQPHSQQAASLATPLNILQQTPIVKDSPPSSPGSEAGSSSKKRFRKLSETKDIKLFQNGVASHMLGNQLNPSSSVAQKLTDQLNMEIEAHSIYSSSGLENSTQLLGPPFPGKLSNVRLSTSSQQQPLSNLLSGSSSSSQSGNTHQSLEQLLERQWEQGSQFLMEQAQHFDIASLLSCLHQLRSENVRLEEHVNNLVTRRDHLLAVNARLAIPLNPNVANQGPFNNMHINGPSVVVASVAEAQTARISRSATQHYNVQQTLENGIDFRHQSHQSSNNTTSRHSSSSLSALSTSSSSSTSTFATTTTTAHCVNNNRQPGTNVNTDETRNRNTGNQYQLQQTSYISQQQQPTQNRLDMMDK